MLPSKKLNTGFKGLKESGSMKEMRIEASSTKFVLQQEEEIRYQASMTRMITNTTQTMTSKKLSLITSMLYMILRIISAA